MFLMPIIFYALLVIYEFFPLYKQKQWRDFWVNTVLGVLSFTMIFLISLGVKIPSPEKPIREFIVYLFGK